MKKVLVIALALMMLLGITACQGSNDAEVEALKLQIELMQKQLDESKNAGDDPSAAPVEEPVATPEPAAPVEYESGDMVLALNCTIDGQTSLIIDGATELTAAAVIPEGMAVDHWELNGAQYHEDMEDTFSFTAEGATVVDARLRPEHKVTAINAEMQFLNKKGNHDGDEFTEFVFEEDYENPVTNEMLAGGWITVYVEAVVPKGYAVDYWLINDVPYYYNRTVTNFTVYDLNETTVYEVVLKEESAPSSTPKPTAKPTQSVYIPEPEPVVKYDVSCEYCTFSGGGYSGASSGSVPEGTVITVTSKTSNAIYWEGSCGYGDKWHPEANSFTFTVDSDCWFRACLIVN